jgi:hypothetical protein
MFFLRYESLIAALICAGSLSGCSTLTSFYPEAGKIQYSEIGAARAKCKTMPSGYTYTPPSMEVPDAYENETISSTCNTHDGGYTYECTSQTSSSASSYQAGVAVGSAIGSMIAASQAKKAALVDCMRSYGYTNVSSKSSVHGMTKDDLIKILKQGDIESSEFLSVADALYTGKPSVQNVELAYILYLLHESASIENPVSKSSILEKAFDTETTIRLQIMTAGMSKYEAIDYVSIEYQKMVDRYESDDDDSE